MPQTEKEKLMGDEKNPEKDFEKKTKKKIEKEPEKQTKKAPKPKKKKKKGKAGFLFILLILLAVIGAGVYLLIPSKNRVSHNQYFGLEDDNQYGLIVNSEIVDITNGAPFEENGVWYLPFSTLTMRLAMPFIMTVWHYYIQIRFRHIRQHQEKATILIQMESSIH